MSKRRVDMKLLSAHLCTPPTSHTNTYTLTFIVSILYFFFAIFVYGIWYAISCYVVICFLFVCAKCCEMYKLMMIYDSERIKNRRNERHRKRAREREGWNSFFCSLPLKNRYTCVWLKILIVWAFILCTPNQRYMHTYSKHIHRSVYSSNSNKELLHIFFMLRMNI